MISVIMLISLKPLVGYGKSGIHRVDYSRYVTMIQFRTLFQSIVAFMLVNCDADPKRPGGRRPKVRPNLLGGLGAAVSMISQVPQSMLKPMEQLVPAPIAQMVESMGSSSATPVSNLNSAKYENIKDPSEVQNVMIVPSASEPASIAPVTGAPVSVVTEPVKIPQPQPPTIPRPKEMIDNDQPQTSEFSIPESFDVPFGVNPQLASQMTKPEIDSITKSLSSAPQDGQDNSLRAGMESGSGLSKIQRKNLFNLTSTLDNVVRTLYTVFKILKCISDLATD